MTTCNPMNHGLTATAVTVSATRSPRVRQESASCSTRTIAEMFLSEATDEAADSSSLGFARREAAKCDLKEYRRDSALMTREAEQDCGHSGYVGGVLESDAIS